jgi:hypothetical protein
MACIETALFLIQCREYHRSSEEGIHRDNVTLRGVRISACRTVEVVVPSNPPGTQFVHRCILQNVINVLGGFGGASDRKRPCGRPKHRWENNIKMVLEEVGWGGTNCVDLTQDRDGLL